MTLTREDLNTLQAILASVEAEKLIGPHICGNFDADKIANALDMQSMAETMFERSEEQIEMCKRDNLQVSLHNNIVSNDILRVLLKKQPRYKEKGFVSDVKQ